VRELRQLVPFAIAIVLAIAALPLPAAIPIVLPLVIAAAISRAMRGRTWNEVSHGGASRAAIGALAGGAALAFAAVIGTQSLVVLYSGQAGDHVLAITDLAGATQGVSVIVVGTIALAMIAFATELALRGWIVERVLELSPGAPTLPILVGAIAEALVTPGDPPTRIAAAIFGAGLGWIYVAGGRSVVAPAFARIVFQCGAFLLEALRLV